MIYEESFTDISDEKLRLIQDAIPNSFIEKLKDGGLDFAYPTDRELEFKVKYDISEFGGSISIKVSWDGDVEEVDDDDDEDEDEEDEDEIENENED